MIPDYLGMMKKRNGPSNGPTNQGELHDEIVENWQTSSDKKRLFLLRVLTSIHAAAITAS